MNIDIFNNTFAVISIFMLLLVTITYINHQYFHLPTTIAVMSGALIISILIATANYFDINIISNFSKQLMLSVNFDHLLMQWMLSFLLFAGSLNIDFSTLKSEAKTISIITLLGVVISTFLLGYLIYGILILLHHPMQLQSCFIFGALISPTDPIAVLATFKKLGASKKIRVIVAGESLFNDGVGIVMFYTLLHFAGNTSPTIGNISKLFCQQTLGGICFGMLIGYLAHLTIKKSNDHLISILTTLTLTTAGYTIASYLSVSGPLAMVVAGIFIGNKAQRGSNEDKINKTLYIFWEVIDEVLNAALFLLLGLELIVISAPIGIIIAALCAIPLALLARFISIIIPLRLCIKNNKIRNETLRVLTWGGLKGGLAVALALSIPKHLLPAAEKNIIICMTFAIVTFSIIVQGSTVSRCLPKKSQPIDL
jgi:monovalent cation:H+ antiporter, CPA1 family